MESGEKKFSVEFCLPVFNEERILRKSVLKLLDHCHRANFDFDWKVVVVNNGSVDKSEEICRTISDPRCIIENVTEAGRGRALRNYWHKSRADILAYMDIDLAVSLGHVEDLITPLLSGKSDLVIGSRLLPASKISRSLIREASSKGYNLISRLILAHPYRDLQCGFKAVNRTAFESVFPYLEENRWFFDTELIIFAHRQKLRIREIPVDWSENRYDLRKSKVKIFRDSLFFLKNLVKLKFRLSRYHE